MLILACVVVVSWWCCHLEIRIGLQPLSYSFPVMFMRVSTALFYSKHAFGLLFPFSGVVSLFFVSAAFLSLFHLSVLRLLLLAFPISFVIASVTSK